MKVQILSDSLNPITNNRITTYLIEGFPKQLVAQFNTHGVICRNWESSRARPTTAVIKQVCDDPYVPIFTKNQRGMTGEIITNPEEERKFNLNLRDKMVNEIEIAISEGVDIHKENLNRYLEPWMKVSGISTSTFWSNEDPKNPGFFQLRNHPHAQPNIQKFAELMQFQYEKSIPDRLDIGSWHKPWKENSIQINTARCAGVSYASHNKDISDEKRINLHDDLKGNKHLSPFSHCSMCIQPGMDFNGYSIFDPWNISESIGYMYSRYNKDLNKIISTAQYGGFLQYRKLMEKDLDVK